MRVLVTGGAGFIGSHTCEMLLKDGHHVVVIDNFNTFYTPAVKRKNIMEVAKAAAANDRELILCEGDITDSGFITSVFDANEFDAVIHLAAAAGVRPSIEKPLFYEEVNIRGTMLLLEAARTKGVKRFLFASSSSVYGDNPKVPFAESDPVDTPISPYAATKKAGELICHTYHHLFSMNISCLRFFTVYGPRQRPDLAISKFTGMIDRGEKVPFFGDGTTSRDYTYIDDIIAGVRAAFNRLFTAQNSWSIYNLGGSRPIELNCLVSIIEEGLGKRANLQRLPSQPGDVSRTWADISRAEADLNYTPRVTIEQGISEYIRWYRQSR